MSKTEKTNKPEAPKAETKPEPKKRVVVESSIKSEADFYDEAKKLKKLAAKEFGNTKAGRLLGLKYQKEWVSEQAEVRLHRIDEQIKRMESQGDPKAKIQSQIERLQAQLVKLSNA